MKKQAYDGDIFTINSDNDLPNYIMPESPRLGDTWTWRFDSHDPVIYAVEAVSESLNAFSNCIEIKESWPHAAYFLYHKPGVGIVGERDERGNLILIRQFRFRDFNGDGNIDILWRHAGTGNHGVWLMSGMTEMTWKYIGNHGAAWDIKGVGDFNDDGINDILWRHANSNFGVWLMGGATETTWKYIGNHGAAWDIKGVGDFNNDGMDDMVWRHSNGNCGVWLMNGTTETTWKYIGNHGAAWGIKGVGDLNNDGMDDMVWRHSNGNFGVWLMDGPTETTWKYIGNHGAFWDIR